MKYLANTIVSVSEAHPMHSHYILRLVRFWFVFAHADVIKYYKVSATCYTGIRVVVSEVKSQADSNIQCWSSATFLHAYAYRNSGSPQQATACVSNREMGGSSCQNNEKLFVWCHCRCPAADSQRETTRCISFYLWVLIQKSVTDDLVRLWQLYNQHTQTVQFKHKMCLLCLYNKILCTYRNKIMIYLPLVLGRHPARHVPTKSDQRVRQFLYDIL